MQLAALSAGTAAARLLIARRLCARTLAAAHSKDDGHHHQQTQQPEADRTGVWNGPAPRGEAAPPRHVSRRESHVATPRTGS